MKYLLICVSLTFALMSSIACSSADIYEDNPFTDSPEIRTIAVAPFIIPESMVDVANPPFEPYVFKTSDDRPVYYSIEFADIFANELAKFPGIDQVITPERVQQQWIFSEDAGTPANPMASRDQMFTVARNLKVDAIVVGEVKEWDSYAPSLSLHWELYYTKSRSSSVANIRDTERMGMGGTSNTTVDYNKTPVHSEQITLRTEDKETRSLLESYGCSLETVEPYDDVWRAIVAAPNPYFVRFAAWVAMSKAFESYNRAREAQKNE